MDELDGHGSFPDGARDPLDRSSADITGGEDPGQARLEEVRVAVESPAGCLPSSMVALPVGMKPPSSRLTSGGTHSVRGCWPMNTNRADRGRVSDVGSPGPVVQVKVALARWPSPVMAVTCVWKRTSTLGVPAIWSIRYWLIDDSSVVRTRMSTRFAKRARYTAAWPAELPPPTTPTSRSRYRTASVTAAP
jgi:hypothetical protein